MTCFPNVQEIFLAKTFINSSPSSWWMMTIVLTGQFEIYLRDVALFLSPYDFKKVL